MYRHILQNQMQALKDAGLIQENQIDNALTVLEKYWENSIAIVWDIEDVFDRAEDLGKKVTEEQAQDILKDVFRKLDASQGVTWETFDHWIYKYNT